MNEKDLKNKKKKEEEKKKEELKRKDKDHIITEDGTLSSFGFQDNYNIKNRK